MLKNQKKLLKISLVVLMIISTIILLTGCGKNEQNESSEDTDLAYLQPLKDYFDGIINKDVDQIIKAFPDFMEMADTITSEDVEDLYTQYESLYGANININYEFGTATAIDEEELTELEEEIVELYDNIDSIDITAGYTVPVTVTITGDGIQNTESTEDESTEDESTEDESTEDESTEDDEETTEESTDNVEQDNMYVLQYNGNWYIM